MACQFTSDTHNSGVYAKKVSSYVPIYTVTVANGCGTSTSGEFQLGECPPQLMAEPQGVSVFPNPASGFVHIKLLSEDGSNAASEVYIRDQFSTIKYHREENDQELDIDVSRWRSGTYYLTVIRAGQTLTRTFVVNNEAITSPSSDHK